MANIHVTACPVCGNDKFSPYLSCKDNLVSGDIFHLLKCDKCGFVFTQDFPDENSIGKYYEAAEYVSHSDTQKGIINTLYHVARKSALKSKRKLVQRSSGKTDGVLLDIGAGTGYFLNEMKQAGWGVEGIEKSDAARMYAKDKFGIVSNESEHLFQIAEKSKDVITLWHVLEHLEKLNETMQQIHKMLKDDGTLIIALPNKQSLDATYYKESWAAYDVPRHLWHFSPDDFQLLAQRNGFTLTAMKPMHLDVFYISMLSEQSRKTALATFAGLLKGELFFLKSLSNVSSSSSITYVLKKK